MRIFTSINTNKDMKGLKPSVNRIYLLSLVDRLQGQCWPDTLTRVLDGELRSPIQGWVDQKRPKVYEVLVLYFVLSETRVSTGKLTDEKKSLGGCKSDRKTSPARAPCDTWRAGWMQLELGN